MAKWRSMSKFVFEGFIYFQKTCSSYTRASKATKELVEELSLFPRKLMEEGRKELLYRQFRKTVKNTGNPQVMMAKRYMYRIPPSPPGLKVMDEVKDSFKQRVEDGPEYLSKLLRFAPPLDKQWAWQGPRGLPLWQYPRGLTVREVLELWYSRFAPSPDQQWPWQGVEIEYPRGLTDREVLELQYWRFAPVMDEVKGSFNQKVED